MIKLIIIGRPLLFEHERNNAKDICIYFNYKEIMLCVYCGVKGYKKIKLLNK